MAVGGEVGNRRVQIVLREVDIGDLAKESELAVNLLERPPRRGALSA